MRPVAIIACVSLLLTAHDADAAEAAADWHEWIDRQAQSLQGQVVDWRRHFHANPELSNREFDTAAYLAEFL